MDGYGRWDVGVLCWLGGLEGETWLGGMFGILGELFGCYGQGVCRLLVVV